MPPAKVPPQWVNPATKSINIPEKCHVDILVLDDN